MPVLWRPTRPGDRFYKRCRKDSEKCRFYEWQEDYEKYLPLHPDAYLGEHQISTTALPAAAPPRAVTVAEQQAAVILAMVKDLLRLNLMVGTTSLMAKPFVIDLDATARHDLQIVALVKLKMSFIILFGGGVLQQRKQKAELFLPPQGFVLSISAILL